MDSAARRSVAVLRRMQAVVRPGGFLFMGGVETTIGIDDTWERFPVGRSSVCGLNARRAA